MAVLKRDVDLNIHTKCDLLSMINIVEMGEGKSFSLFFSHKINHIYAYHGNRIIQMLCKTAILES